MVYYLAAAYICVGLHCGIHFFFFTSGTADSWLWGFCSSSSPVLSGLWWWKCVALPQYNVGKCSDSCWERKWTKIEEKTEENIKETLHPVWAEGYLFDVFSVDRKMKTTKAWKYYCIYVFVHLKVSISQRTSLCFSKRQRLFQPIYWTCYFLLCEIRRWQSWTIDQAPIYSSSCG